MSLGDFIDRPEWMARGACTAMAETHGAEARDEVFFPSRGQPTRRAKAICAGCVVRAECLEFALVNGEKYGIWGGTSEHERRRMRSERLAAGTLPKPVKPIAHGTLDGSHRCYLRPEGPCQPCRDARARHKNPDGKWPGDYKRDGAA